MSLGFGPHGDPLHIADTDLVGPLDCSAIGIQDPLPILQGVLPLPHETPHELHLDQRCGRGAIWTVYRPPPGYPTPVVIKFCSPEAFPQYQHAGDSENAVYSFGDAQRAIKRDFDIVSGPLVPLWNEEEGVVAVVPRLYGLYAGKLGGDESIGG